MTRYDLLAEDRHGRRRILFHQPGPDPVTASRRALADLEPGARIVAYKQSPSRPETIYAGAVIDLEEPR